MKLAEIFAKPMLLLNLEARDKRSAIREMLKHLVAQKKLTEDAAKKAEKGIQEREADGSTVRTSVDLRGLVHQALPALNLAVEPGDIVYVPTAETFRIFVGGAVRSPSRYMIPRNEPMTVLKAITLAGGTTERAAEKKVQVIRTQADGRRIYLSLNLKKVKRGRGEDLVLKEGDVVLVPERFF